MDKQSAIRRVRIAVSVFFGVVAVALCVLWVRSYWQVDRFGVRAAKTQALCVATQQGILNLILTWPNSMHPFGITIESESIAEMWEGTCFSPPNSSAFPIVLYATGTHLKAPLWLAVMASLAAAATPWMRPHFSLRSMLLATTLVAIVLGLAVWASRFATVVN